MDMKERLLEHPAAFFAGCLVWVPIAIWIFALVSWTIQGDTDVITLIVGVGVALALGYFTMMPPDPRLGPIFAFAVLLLVVLFPFIRMALNRRELVEFDIDAVERAYVALGQRPGNPALRFRLAKALYTRGMIDAAVAIGERSIPELPRQHYGDEHRAFLGWTQYASKPAPTFFRCIGCGFENRPGEPFCQGCGGRLFLAHASGKWVGRDFARKMVILWGCLVLLGVGIPTAADTLVPFAAIGVVLLMLGLAGYGVFAAFQTPERPA